MKKCVSVFKILKKIAWNGLQNGPWFSWVASYLALFPLLSRTKVQEESFSAIWVAGTLSKLWGVKRRKWHLSHSLKLKFKRTPINPNVRHFPVNGLSYISPSFFIKTVIISHHNQNFSKWKCSVPKLHQSLTLSLSPSFSLVQLKSLLHLFLSFFSFSLFNWSQLHSTNAPSACPPRSFHCFW